MTAVSGLVRRRESLLGPALALVLGAVVVVAARWGPDWPAQEFRAWAATYEGLSVWTNRWYGGQVLPSYSVLYPIAAAVLGAGLTGLLASVGAAWAASGFAPANRTRARLFQLSVAVGLTENLLIGQVPFLLGAALGLLAIRALRTTQSVVVVAILAALCGLSSPLAGVFLLVAAPALGMAFGWRRVLGVAGALVGPAVASVVGGSGGWFPFQWQALGAVFGLCAVVVVAARNNRPVQCFAMCYLLVAIAMFVIPNPIGGNFPRLGKLIALPLACHFLLAVHRRHWARTVVVAVLAVLWSGVPMASSIARGATDPSRRLAFYSGLLHFLKTQNPNAGRIEIPFTREHWEALWVARSFPIARGWERQTDLERNAVLYDKLTATAYHRWLDDNSVSLVALPNVPIDYGGRAEVALIDAGPSYLRPVWHDRNWSVCRVVGARPMVTGATLVRMRPTSITVHFRSAGTATVHIRGSNLWQVRGTSGCVDSTRRGWLAVHSPRGGTVTIDASVNGELFAPRSRCRN